MDSRKGKGKDREADMRDLVVADDHVPQATAADSVASNETTLDAVLKNPIVDQIKLEEVLISSTLQSNNAREQAQQIVTAYNHDVKRSWFVGSNFRGKSISPGECYIGTLNGQPMLAPFNPKYRNVATRITSPGNEVVMGDRVSITSEFYGMSGRYVLNVPVGQYVLASSANKPKIYGPGPHVIIDATFQFASGLNIAATDRVNISNPYIHHGNIHIVRVPQGSYGLVTIDGTPILLAHRVEPYVFKTNNFSQGQNLLVDQSEAYIHHGNLRIIRVPEGKFAAISINGRPKLLPPRATPYVFNTPYMATANPLLIDQSQAYITHGSTIHILRVPQGKIAKVWINNTPELLEYRAEPYEFDTPYFRLERKSKDEMFYDGTDQCIIHGPIKRIIPHAGEVAVTFNNGQLKIIPPSSDSKAIRIDSLNHEFKTFLATNLTIMNLPSERTKAQRRRDNERATADEISSEICQTSDSVPFAIKLVVVYEIADPELAVSTIGLEDIEPYIEMLAVADMTRAIQKRTSQNFLSSGAVKTVTSGDNVPVASNYQEEARDELARHLALNGIRLIRLNIESAKNMNREISNQMEQQAVRMAEVNAQEAALVQRTRITVAESEQKAKAAQIAQEQQNQGTISMAEADFKAAEIRNRMRVASAEAEARAQEMEGAVLAKFPALVDIRKAKLLSEAMVKTSAPILLTTPGNAGGLMGSPAAFFSATAPSAAPRGDAPQSGNALRNN